ncbi:MAG TPA: flagellar basal body rod protein FlgC [Syntrophales bacterium]|nr:flagellar basal body rod protein FlgC [Syntrophales bacterium]HOM07616.1 flagellar basal body rod protein FlgC [Syntrophales bacterium]HON99436.1 flagellar basal body rod protein FlgC [Syntrophales bacterium]HPC00528.1 flagellar basal body rod protein FlgC [Syntrophales bacterium]HPQ06699.1 flagellar basal body rod protein FlgC [Syntrophales bacterium]
MDLSTTFKICADGMSAQRARLDVVASNLANIDTTRTPEGGPYRRRSLVLSSEKVASPFAGAMEEALKTVKKETVVEDAGGGRQVYDPSHPDADARGMVTLPNVNVVTEMADMISASRSFEACVSAFDATKSMTLKALDIGK